VERLNRGEELHPQEILAKHPVLGEDLLASLEGYVDPDSTVPVSPCRTLGDYTLRREIGRGGMGVVYDAWQNSLDRRVALKVLPVGIAASDRAFDRFMREARTAAKLDHQNIVRVHGMGVEANTPYYSMEHVEGRTLAQIIARITTPGTEDDAASDVPFTLGSDRGIDYSGIALALAEVADGLQHAHSRGVIHRDIKPSNLILDSEGRLRILDFGLARFEGEPSLTLTGDVLGTPFYMSPEQARRRQIPIDHRTDIYSLGATLYELLTRRPPFDGDDQREMLSRIIEQDPQPLRRVDPAIPRELETIVLKCLRKSARDRYDTAQALAEDLRRFASGEPIDARPLPRWRSPVRWVRQHALRIGAAIMLLTAISVLAYSLLQPQDLVNERVLSTSDIHLNDFWEMRPSPDGRQVAYSAMGDDGSLFVRDLGSGSTEQLTRGERTWSTGPVWSPDAKRIAYRVQASETLKIVDVASKVSSVPKGAKGLRLTPEAWSPDGAHLLCVMNDADRTWSLVRLSLADGALKTLVPQGLSGDPSAVYSRDGRFIAYSAFENDTWHVFIIDVNGDRRTRITETPGSGRYPLWSPAGDELAYVSEHSIWMVRIEDGRPSGQPRFVRSGMFGQPLAWTPEGLFSLEGNDVFAFYALPIDVGPGETIGRPRQLLDSSIRNGFLCAWSPDMSRIAFTQLGGKIGVYSPSDGSLRYLSIGSKRRPRRIWWSSDGQTIFCEPRDPRGRHVLAVDATGVDRQPLFPPVEWGGAFHLSPDGGEMAFYHQRDDGSRELMIAEVGGREGRVLASEREEALGAFSNWVTAYPRVSPDGRHVLFGTRRGDVWMANVDGSGKRKLGTVDETEFEGQPARFVHSVAWHPRGTHVVFDNWQTVYVVDVETGAQRRFTVDDGRIEHLTVLQWSPDGEHIVIKGGRGSGPEVWVIRNLLPDDKGS
jgi:serine/threonine protein kinase